MLPKLLSFSTLLVAAFNTYGQPTVSEVINAEISFAKMAFEKNMQAAFLHYMSDSSVIEQRGKLVKGYPLVSKQSPDTTGKLLWHPTFAAISSSGDFGYTTGPYTYNINGKKVAFGNYATVWQKQSDGKWKFIIDLGAGHRDTAAVAKDTIISILPDATARNTVSTDLLAIDKNFAARLAAGSSLVYTNVLHPAARILRQGKDVYVSEQQKQALFSESTKISFMPEQFKMAASNDMGVVYGLCETETVKDGKSVRQTGVYMHVWRRDAVKGWQILHETIHTSNSL